MSRIPPKELAEIAAGDFKLQSVRTYIAGFVAGILDMRDQVGEVLNALDMCARSMIEKGVLDDAAVVAAAIMEPPGEYVMRVFVDKLSETEGKGAHILDVLTGANRAAWLKSFDPEAFGGGGAIDLTDDISDAMRFPTWVAVADMWRTQSKVRPLHENGKPNCPLAAYTIQPERIDDV